MKVNITQYLTSGIGEVILLEFRNKDKKIDEHFFSIIRMASLVWGIDSDAILNNPDFKKWWGEINPKDKLSYHSVCFYKDNLNAQWFNYGFDKAYDTNRNSIKTY